MSYKQKQMEQSVKKSDTGDMNLILGTNLIAGTILAEDKNLYMAQYFLVYLQRDRKY